MGVERASIVGHSMGGRTMFSFVLDYPERVTALVAVGAHSEAPHGQYRDILAGVRDSTLADGISGFYRSFAAADEIPHRVRTDPDYAGRFAAWFARNRPVMIAAALDGILAMPTLTPMLSQIRAPMASIVGEQDVHFRELADRYAILVPRCRTTIVPDCGHYPMVDARELFSARLVEFLDEVHADG
jgi:pimeloyl-ACP methyl ester carboxylesterase